MILSDFFGNFFKYLFLAILCLVPVVILGAGVYCGLELYREKTSVSQNFGTLEEHDLYEDFNVFDCDLSSATFYQAEGGGYEYTTTIPKAVPFDGSKNKYNVLVNNQPSTAEQSTAGILTAKNTINYYGVEGNEIQQTTLTIEMRFYQSRVQISIANSNTAEQQALFLEYIQFNGLKLRTIEAQYVPTISTSEYYTITFLGKDGSLITSSKVAKGAIIVAPKAPEYVGFVFAGWSPEVPTYATKNQTFSAIYTEDTSYIQVFVDGVVIKSITQNDVIASIEDYDLSLNDVYPVLQVADNAGNYCSYNLNLDRSSLQKCYDIICTTQGDNLTVTFGTQSQTFVISSDITFIVELFDIDSNHKSDSFSREFAY